MVSSARGFVFVAVLFVSSLLYSVTLLTPALLLLIPISPPGVYLCFRRAYRRWSGFVGYLFFAMAAFLLENLCGIKVRTYVRNKQHPSVVVVEAQCCPLWLRKGFKFRLGLSAARSATRVAFQTLCTHATHCVLLSLNTSHLVYV